MSELEPSCPKCGGKMRKGEMQVPVLHQRAQPLSPFTPGSYMGGIPSVSEEVSEKLLWEERTGEMKGTIFKREGTKRMAVSGFRCTLCGYIELYAKEK